MKRPRLFSAELNAYTRVPYPVPCALLHVPRQRYYLSGQRLIHNIRLKDASCMLFGMRRMMGQSPRCNIGFCEMYIQLPTWRL